MSDATLDLIFWVVVLVGLFVLFRWLQKRKSDRDDDPS